VKFRISMFIYIEDNNNLKPIKEKFGTDHNDIKELLRTWMK